MTSSNNIMALDVGDVRIGVAVANGIARLPQPLTTLTNGPEVNNQIAQLIRDQDVSRLVVGLPRGLNGQETEQTRKVRDFVEQLKQQLTVGVHLQDEAATSIQAEAELEHGKKPYTKAEIDARAAVIILDDFLREQGSHFYPCPVPSRSFATPNSIGQRQLY